MSFSRAVTIGSRSRKLSDLLMLTSLPSRIKAQMPQTRVGICPGRLSRAVFKNHPHVDGLSLRLRGGLGDDAMPGSEHLIQLRERYLGLIPCDNPKPEIFFSDSERAWARDFIRRHTLPENDGKPICVIHPWRPSLPGGLALAPVSFWDELVRRNRHHFRFWQIGLQFDSAVQGCEYYYLARRRSGTDLRRVAALLAEADRFIGVCSAPMHLARAVDIPSLILLDSRINMERPEAQPTELYAAHQKAVIFRQKLEENQSSTFKIIDDFLAIERMGAGADQACHHPLNVL